MQTDRPCVIFNPAAASRSASLTIRQVTSQVGDAFSFLPTTHPSHATALASAAAQAGVPVVIAAGGDGTVHEVVNGLLDSGNRDVVFSVWPIGSANDYARSLGLLDWWRRPDRFARPRTVRQADVGRVSTPDRSRWFANCLGLGFNAAVTLESRRIHGLRGMFLYGLGLFHAFRRHFTHLPVTVTFDGESSPHTRTLMLSVNLGKREGGFPLTPAARLDDGLFDTIHGGELRRWHLLRFLPNMALGTLPTTHPLLRVGQCRRVEVRSAVPFRVHTDGEFVCQPEDGVRELTVEVVPARLCVETWPDAPAHARAL